MTTATITITTVRPTNSNRDLWHVYASEQKPGQDPGEARVFAAKEFHYANEMQARYHASSLLRKYPNAIIHIR